jgi:hypothetical protein
LTVGAAIRFDGFGLRIIIENMLMPVAMGDVFLNIHRFLLNKLP